MSTRATRQEEIADAVRQITGGDEDARARLLDAIEDVPFTSIDEARLDSGIYVGARGIDRDVRDAFQERGTGSAPLASWIRGHLQDVEGDYPYRMWKRFVFFTYWRIPQYHHGDYDDFRTMIWKLRELGLVEPTRTEPAAAPGRKDRQFYGLVAGQAENAAWGNPTDALYPEEE